MAQRISTPNGIVEFPDGMSSEDITGVLKKHYEGLQNTNAAKPVEVGTIREMTPEEKAANPELTLEEQQAFDARINATTKLASEYNKNLAQGTAQPKFDDQLELQVENKKLVDAGRLPFTNLEEMNKWKADNQLSEDLKQAAEEGGKKLTSASNFYLGVDAPKLKQDTNWKFDPKQIAFTFAKTFADKGNATAALGEAISKPIAIALANQGVGLVDFMLSPVGIGTMELGAATKLPGVQGKIAKLGMRGVSAYFAADMIQNGAQQLLVATDETKAPAERIEAGVNATAAFVFSYLTAKHAITGEHGWEGKTAKDADVAFKENIQKVPTEHIQAFLADKRFMDKWRYDPKILQAELDRRLQIESAPESTKAAGEIGIPTDPEAPLTPTPTVEATAPKTTEKVVAAAYKDENGVIHEGKDHNGILNRLNKTPLTRNQREADPSLGFIVVDAEGKRKFVTRQTAGEVGRASGQITGDPTSPVPHSSEFVNLQPGPAWSENKSGAVASPTEAGELKTESASVSPSVGTPTAPEPTPTLPAEGPKGESEPSGVAPVPPAPETGSSPIESPSNTIGIRHTKINEQRASLGLSPLNPTEQLSVKALGESAETIMRQDPELVTNLVTELEQNPTKAIGPVAVTMLLKHNKNLLDTLAKHEKEIAAAEKMGNQPLREAAERRYDETLTELDRVNKVAKQGGGVWGATGRALQNELNGEGSLRRMEINRKRAKGGEELTKEDKAEIRELHKRLTDAQTELEELRSKPRKDAVNKFVTKTIAETKAVKAQAKGLRAVREKFQPRVDAARQRIRESLKQNNTGIDPSLIVDHAVIIADALLEGSIKVGDIAGKLVGEFGEAIKPHVDEISKQARKIYLDMSKKSDMTTEEMRQFVNAKRADGQEVTKNEFVKLAKQHVKDGALTIEELQGKLQEDFPEMTPDQIQDKVAGYAKDLPEPTPAEHSAYKDVVKQALTKSQIRDIDNPAPVRESGPKPKPSQRLKEPQEEKAKEEQKRKDYEAEAGKKAEAIWEKVEEVKSGERKPTNRTATVDTEAVAEAKTALVEARKDLRERLNKIKEAPTGDVVEKKTIEALEKQLDRLENPKPTETKAPLQGPKSEKVTDLSDQIAEARELKSVKERLERLQTRRETAPKAEKPSTPEIEAVKVEIEKAKAEKADATRIEALEKKLENLKAGVTAPTKPKVERVKSPRELEIEKEIKAEEEKIKEEKRKLAETSGEKEKKAHEARVKNLEKRLEELEISLITGEPVPKKSTAPKLTPSREEQIILEKIAKAKREIVKRDREIENANLPLPRRIAKGLVTVAREAALMFVKTIEKVMASSLLRLPQYTLEELGGMLLKEIRSDLSKRSEMEGHTDFKAIWELWAGAFSKETARGVWQIVKGQATYIDAFLGKEVENFSLGGRIHKAEKYIATHGKFMMDSYKAMKGAEARGENVMDPFVKDKILTLAANKSLEAAFMERNKALDAFQRLVRMWERSPDAGAYYLSQLFKGENLIIRVPGNMAKENYQMTFGIPRAMWKEIQAKGDANAFTPEEADFTLKLYKKGLVGAAMFWMGVFFFKNTAGKSYYDQTERSKKEKLKGVPEHGQIGPFNKTLTHQAMSYQLMTGAAVARAWDEGGWEMAREIVMNLYSPLPYAPQMIRDVSIIQEHKDGVMRVTAEHAASFVPGFIREAKAEEPGTGVRHNPQTFKDYFNMKVNPDEVPTKTSKKAKFH